MASDLCGRRFGHLLVLQETEPSFYLCRCDCGNTVVWRESLLLSGYVHSCGCGQGDSHKRDLCGLRSGRVQVLEPTRERRRGAVLWRCRCDCGREFLTEGYKIVHGLIKSCGCGRGRKKSPPKVQPPHKNLNKNNTSGYTGVVQLRGKWRAQISYRGRHYSLGTYGDIQSAVAARKAAEEQLGSGFLRWYREQYPPRQENTK